MKQVVAALYPQALGTSLTLPMDLLRAASQAATAAQREPHAVQCRLAGLDLAPVSTVGGLTLVPELEPGALADCDMLLLPAMWRNPQPIIRTQHAWLPVLRPVLPTSPIRSPRARCCPTETLNRAI